MRRLHATTWRDSRGVPAASRHWFSATRHRVAAGSTDVREGARMPTDDNAGADRIGLAGRTTTAFGVPGAAVMAAVDEIVVHQLLLASLPRPVHHRRRAGVGRGTAHDRGHRACRRFRGGRRPAAAHAPSGPQAWAGFFLGLGRFQLFDATVHHKLLHVHQVRHGVDLLPYDLAFRTAWRGAGQASCCWRSAGAGDAGEAYGSFTESPVIGVQHHGETPGIGPRPVK